METKSDFAIIGAGVAGLTAAIMLQRLNRDFMLLERAPILKGLGAGFGLAANAMQAMELLSLRKDVEQVGYYLDSFAILNSKGKILVEPSTQSISDFYDQKNFAIHRADLHSFLMERISSEKILLGKEALHFEKEDPWIIIHFKDGSSHRCKYLLIADGIKSALRQQILPEAKPRYAGYSCWRATISNSQIKLGRGSETWGRAGRFGMTPLIHNRIYWYACINGPANYPKFRDYKIADLQAHFSHYHHPIPEILQQTHDEDLIWSDIMDIKPLDKIAFDNILLLGDAAHACTPNMGQGACQALEDVAVLQDELKMEKSVPEAFLSFEKRRKDRTKYITETSKLIGEVAQWDNPLLIAARNFGMQIMPNSMGNKSLNRLFEENFMTINT